MRFIYSKLIEVNTLLITTHKHLLLAKYYNSPLLPKKYFFETTIYTISFNWTPCLAQLYGLCFCMLAFIYAYGHYRLALRH